MGGNGSYKHTMETPGRKIVMTRVFDAPRELVFDAHSSCEHMSHWWGPRKYEVVTCEIDFRPGGTWRIVHRGPEGGSTTPRRSSASTARSFAPSGSCGRSGSRACRANPGPRRTSSRSTTARRRSRRTSEFDTVEQRDALLETGMEEGAAETWDRLDEYLRELAER